jgi:hypothetical protein
MTIKSSRQIARHWRLRFLSIGVALLAGSMAPRLLVAQSPAQTDNAVQIGDHWTIDTKDEITNSPTDTVTYVVTDLSPTEIVARVTTRGKSGTGLVVFDRNWNRIENSNWKWKPNDGEGVRFPLGVGKDWRVELEARNTQSGDAHKITVLSKVAAEEPVTTAAGSFDTFRIETKGREVSAKDPSKIWEHENVTWYAPLINHWVRRTLILRAQKRITSNTSEEVVDFGRKL